jgi:hypothetical protein
MLNSSILLTAFGRCDGMQARVDVGEEYVASVLHQVCCTAPKDLDSFFLLFLDTRFAPSICESLRLTLKPIRMQYIHISLSF